MKIPYYIHIFRIIAILVGFLIIAGSAYAYFAAISHVAPNAPAWRYVICFLSGIFLVVPHRKIFKTRLGPLWLAFSILIPVLAGCGLAMNAWLMHTEHKNVPIIFWGSVVIWLVVCENAECARRAFLTNQEV